MLSSDDEEYEIDTEVKRNPCNLMSAVRCLGRECSPKELERHAKEKGPFSKVFIAVAAARDHIPSLKMMRHKLPLCSDNHPHHPKPCPWVDDMAFDQVVPIGPLLNRDQFRDRFQAFHLMIINPDDVNHLKGILTELIIMSRNPFHEDDQIFANLFEDTSDDVQAVDDLEKEKSLLKESLARIRSSASPSAIGLHNDQGGESTLRINDLAFHQWYMDDSNFHDAQAYFCLSALITLTAAVSVPQQVQKDLQTLLAENYSAYSFRKPPPFYPKVSKESAGRLCSSPTWHGLMGTVLMILDGDKFPDRKTSDRERNFLNYLMKTAESGPWFGLLQFIERAADDLGVDIESVGGLCSAYFFLRNSWTKVEDARKLIAFYKKGIRYEKDGKVHTFKYWPFAPFFETACFKEILKSKNAGLLAFCIGLSGRKQKGALKMCVLKNDGEAREYYHLGLTKRAEILSKGSKKGATKSSSTNDCDRIKRAKN